MAPVIALSSPLWAFCDGLAVGVWLKNVYWIWRAMLLNTACGVGSFGVADALVLAAGESATNDSGARDVEELVAPPVPSTFGAGLPTTLRDEPVESCLVAV